MRSGSFPAFDVQRSDGILGSTFTKPVSACFFKKGLPAFLRQGSPLLTVPCSMKQGTSLIRLKTGYCPGCRMDFTWLISSWLAFAAGI